MQPSAAAPRSDAAQAWQGIRPLLIILFVALRHGSLLDYSAFFSVSARGSPAPAYYGWYQRRAGTERAPDFLTPEDQRKARLPLSLPPLMTVDLPNIVPLK
jgi:hypothetical protein